MCCVFHERLAEHDPRGVTGFDSRDRLELFDEAGDAFLAVHPRDVELLAGQLCVALSQSAGWVSSVRAGEITSISVADDLRVRVAGRPGDAAGEVSITYARDAEVWRIFEILMRGRQEFLTRGEPTFRLTAGEGTLGVWVAGRDWYLSPDGAADCQRFGYVIHRPSMPVLRGSADFGCFLPFADWLETVAAGAAAETFYLGGFIAPTFQFEVVGAGAARRLQVTFQDADGVDGYAAIAFPVVSETLRSVAAAVRDALNAFGRDFEVPTPH